MTGGRTRSGVLAAAIAMALLLCVPGVAAAKTLAKSTFNDSAEKWKVVGDTASDPEKPDHVETGGKPGGFIQVDDAALGGVMYWRAPPEFRGDQSKAFGGFVNWASTQSATDTQFDDVDIRLTGHGKELEYGDIGTNPPAFPAWLQIGIGLFATDGPDWTDVDEAEPATNKDLKRVLSDVDDLQIRAEYRDGDDTDGLDSVSLTTG